jgi:hypothetical protein
VFDESIENQDILNEAGLRYKANTIKDWQLAKLIASMQDRDKLIFPAKLQYDTPAIRKYLFEELASQVTMAGLSYWVVLRRQRIKTLLA